MGEAIPVGVEDSMLSLVEEEFEPLAIRENDC